MDVSETISHHILDHDWGVMLGGFRLPVTTHSVTIFAVSVFLLLILAWAARKHTSRAGKLVSVLTEEYVSFIRGGIVLPNIGEGRIRDVAVFLYTFLVYFICQFGRDDSRNENRHV